MKNKLKIDNYIKKTKDKGLQFCDKCVNGFMWYEAYWIADPCECDVKEQNCI